MRREVLYQYDLPVEILDDISEEEEVLNVLFGRSKEKFLIPVLFSRNRILWGYPETQTVYKVFSLEYVDVLSIFARFPPAGAATLIFRTVGRDIVIPHVQDSVDAVRFALLSAAECIRTLSSRHFSLSNRRNLLTDEYLLHENPNAPVYASDDDIFEDGVLPAPAPAPAPAEVEDDIFARFSRDGEDEVFEEAEDAKEATEAAEAAEAARVARMVEAAETAAAASVSEEPEAEEALPAENDAVVYEPASASRNEQWASSAGGDAVILSRKSLWKKVSEPVQEKISQYLPEDDDSEVYTESARPKLHVPQPKVVTEAPVNQEDEVEIIESVTVLPNSAVKPKAAAKAAPVNQEDEVEIVEKVTVLPNPAVKPRKASAKAPAAVPAPADTPAPEPVMIFRRQKNPEAVTLQPKDGIDEATVDKSLEALRFLRENKIISEAEYKKRSLSLFEKEE